MTVALVMVVVTDLAGSGGAERQFTDLWEHFGRQGQPVSLITARASIDRLKAAGRMQANAPVIALPLGATPASGRIGVAWMTLLLLWVTIRRGFDIVHICLPTPSYVPFAAIIGRLPARLRPRIVLSVIDCTLVANLTKAFPPADLYERQVLDAHRKYFRWSRIDGVYTWYQAFASLARHQRLFGSHSEVRAARYCFTNPQRFRPASQKEKVIVYAGRLSEQKRPLLFIEAIAVLRRRFPELLNGWQVVMYGRGVLERAVSDAIVRLGLQDVVTVTHAIEMAPVFARSRLFVSTQAFENFTSLAMLEAMAAANAVIAEDVGQTREFVRPGENGLLVSSGTPEAFAEAIAEYLRHPQSHDEMGRASRALATEVHTIENFAADITRFWREVMAASAR